MVRTPGPAGALETQTGAAGPLEKNGVYAPAGAAPRLPRRNPWLRGLLTPLAVAALFGTSAFIVADYFVTPWYSTQATLFFPATGSQGAGGMFNSLLGNSSADGAGSVSVLGNMYSVPRVGTSPDTAIMVLGAGHTQALVSNRLHLARRWHVKPDKVGDRLGKNVNFGMNKDGLLAIQATDTDPRTARDIVDAYVQAMQEFAKQLSTIQSHRIHQALQQLQDRKQAQLNMEQDRLVALQTHTTARLPLGGASAGAYADLETQRRAAQAELAETNAKISSLAGQAKRSYAAGLTLSANVPFAQDALQRLHKAEQDFAAVRAVYGPDYPAYQEAQQRVGLARQQAQAEMQRQYTSVQAGITPDVAGLLTQRRGLEARVRAISGASEALRAGLLSLPSAQMQEQRLTTAVARDEKLVDDLAAATQQAGIAEERDVPTFQVVDGAGVPDKPSSPRVLYATALAAVAGFLLALAWQISRAVLRQPATMEELRRWTDRYGLTAEETSDGLEGAAPPASLPGRGVPRLPDADVPEETTPAPAEERARVGQREP